MKSKKLLAMLLVIALAVCIFPVSAFAAPAYEESPVAPNDPSEKGYPDIDTFVTL